MSEYGRLWQRVADIRDALKRLAPNLNTDTLNAARASLVEQQEPREPMCVLLDEWQRIELKMGQLDDE